MRLSVLLLISCVISFSQIGPVNPGGGGGSGALPTSAANTVLAGPASGAPATAAARALVVGDLPGSIGAPGSVLYNNAGALGGLSYVANSAGNLNLIPVHNVTVAPILALAGLGAGNVDNGTHCYQYVYAVPFGYTMATSEASIIASITVTDNTTNGQVSVTVPASADARVVGVEVLRAPTGTACDGSADASQFFDLGIELANGGTVIDNVPDSSFGASALAQEMSFNNTASLACNSGACLQMATNGGLKLDGSYIGNVTNSILRSYVDGTIFGTTVPNDATKFLDGTGAFSVPAATPGAPPGAVQYNLAGALGGDAGFTFDPAVGSHIGPAESTLPPVLQGWTGYGRLFTTDDGSGSGQLVTGEVAGAVTFPIYIAQMPSVSGIGVSVDTILNGAGVIGQGFAGQPSVQPGIAAGSYESFFVRSPFLGAGSTLTDMYGLHILDLTQATNNWAIKTGLGKVEFGDRVHATPGAAGNVGLEVQAATSQAADLFRTLASDGVTVQPFRVLANGTATGTALAGTTGSIGGGLLAAGACATGNVTVTGATTAMVASASPAGGVDPSNGGILGVAIDARVSAANTVQVSVCSPIAGTPTAAAYNVRILQ